MNDKEKLISFINKGKENKPVKEVHIIKDSPTEAHILLVNEDGTNVASNRFEIMDANDLMTLIENPEYSGLIINISEDNKKAIFKTERVVYTFETAIYPTLDKTSQAKIICDKLNELRNLISIAYFSDEIDILEEVESPIPTDNRPYYRVSLSDFLYYLNFPRIGTNNSAYISHIAYYGGKVIISYYNGANKDEYPINETDIANLEEQYGQNYYIYFVKEQSPLQYF